MMSQAMTSLTAADIERTLRVLHDPGEFVEVRAPKTRWGTVSGYYDDFAKCARDVATKLDGKVPAVYMTLNPVKPELAARAYNRLKERADATTQDSDIVRRRWLPIDTDVMRPAGISSTDVEHAGALERTASIGAFLNALGWPEPIRADSGNGGHLLYRIDLPNDAETRSLIERVLHALAAYFADREEVYPRVCVDTSVGNAARIWKLYPTLACKGDNIPARPHRRSQLLSVPERLDVVTREQLLDICDELAPEEEQPAHSQDLPCQDPGDGWITDVDAYLAARGIDVASTRNTSNARKWILAACVWNPAHTDNSAWIMQFTNGVIAAGCLHNSCHGKNLRDFRDAVEPGWRAQLTRTVVAHAEENALEPPADLESHSDVKVQPFPVEVLPVPLRRLVEHGAKAIQCPPDYIGVPLLAHLGSALGNAVALEIKRGWCQVPELWVALVGAPGDRKSPVLKAAEQFAWRQQDQLYAAWQLKHQAWKDSANPGASEPEPVLRQIITTDATLEALADLQAANPRSVVLSQDELTAWALAMNQYKNGRGADRQHWLSLWNPSPIIINRRNRKHPVVISRPFVAVVGSLQPDVLGDLSDERGRNDGFIHRILFAYPDRLPRRWTDEEVDDRITNDAQRVFDLLWDLPMEQADDGTLRPRMVQFTEDGKAAWVKWITSHYAEQDAPGFAEQLRGPWDKMDGYAARLALIVHMCRYVCGDTTSHDVDVASMEGAVKLVDYFKSQARRVYARLYASPEELQIAAAVAWLRRQPGMTTTARELLRSGVAKLKNSDDAKWLLGQLDERGYGKADEITGKRGRTGLRFTMHSQRQIHARHPTSDNCDPEHAGSPA